MSWQDQLKGDSYNWLLENDNPAIQYMAFRHIAKLPDSDPSLLSACSIAHKSGPIASILNEMDESGYWVIPGPGYMPKYRSTVWALILLAQLGARVEQDVRIAKACNYFLEHSLCKGGQIGSAGAPSGTADCLQGNMCWTMLELGFDDPRLDKAFEWMARSVTGEGMASNDDRHAPTRYYAGKCGPTFACGANDKKPCAWGGVKVMLAFGKLPMERRTPLIKRAIQQGVDFFLGIDPALAAYPTGYSDKPSQNWWKFGFPVFYVTDLLQLVEALVNLGYGSDPRLAHALEMISDKQDEKGRWALEYDYKGKTWVEFGEKKKANKWVTLRALRVLKAVYTG
jgi:hypothetical protein